MGSTHTKAILAVKWQGGLCLAHALEFCEKDAATEDAGFLRKAKQCQKHGQNTVCIKTRAVLQG